MTPQAHTEHPPSRPNLLLLDGPTGAGKSTFLAFLRDNYAPLVRVGLRRTTRARRPTDSDWEFRFVPEIPSDADLVYTAVGNRYVIDSTELQGVTESGRCYAVPCTDPELIMDFRRRFRAVVIFIYRPLSRDALASLMRSRGSEDQDELMPRYAEVESVLDYYTANIHLYDFVILNTGTLHDFKHQAKAILSACGFTPHTLSGSGGLGRSFSPP